MKNISLLAAFLLSYFIAFAQQKPILKQQISLNYVSNVIASSKQNTFLAIGGSYYTLIDQSSKIQLGTIQLDIENHGVPSIGTSYLFSNKNFLISTTNELLAVNILTNKIDTIFNQITFPEVIIHYTPTPWNDSILLIATKTYSVNKQGDIQFAKPDVNNNLVYDDTKNCRILLYDIRNKKIIKQTKVDFAVTAFTGNDLSNTITAGTFEGDIFLIDTLLNQQLLFHAFDYPIHSIITEQDYTIAVPHITSKFLGNVGAGKIGIYQASTKKFNIINLPNDTPFVADNAGMQPLPSSYIKKIFSLPKQNTLLVNFGFKRLLKIALPSLDTIEYPVNHNAASFYCFNKDSSLLLAAIEQNAGVFGVTGDIALYDIAQQKFKPSFNKPLTQQKFTSIYKLYDEQGNYHMICYKYNYNTNDSLIVFSSNKTEPTFLVGKNCKFIVNEEEQTLLLNYAGSYVFGKISLDKISNNTYTFFLGYNNNDSLPKSIFTILFDSRKTTTKELPYALTSFQSLNNNQFIVTGYTPSTSTTLHKIVIIDTLGTVVFKTNDFEIGSIKDVCKLSYSKKFMAYYVKSKNNFVLEVWDISKNKKQFSKTFTNKKPLYYFCFDKTKDVLWFSEQENWENIHVFKVDISNTFLQPAFVFTDPSYFSFQVDETNDLIASESYNQMKLARLSNKKIVWLENSLTSYIKIGSTSRGFTYATDKEHYFINNSSSSIYFTAYDGYKPVEILNNYLYKAEKLAIDNLAFTVNDKGYLPSDFDAYFNRPDSVVLAAGGTNKNFNELLQKIIEKRKKKLKLPDLNDVLYKSPSCNILYKTAIKDYTTSNELKCTIQVISNTKAKLQAIHVLDNGIPMFGKNGFVITDTGCTIQHVITIPLISGNNNVQVYASDVDGFVSPSESIMVLADFAFKQTPKTYFIGIGINQFANANYNLTWSVKDIRDLSIKLKTKYSNIIIDTLFDNNVTKENILALKQKLQSLNENDKVMLSYSGHGVLSKGFDYYLSTYTINFDNPQENGLAYEDFENLLDNIKPRKKLMLIDACHSGELDKDEMVRIEQSKNELEKSGTTINKGVTIIKKKEEQGFGMTNSFELMQSLFANVGKSTGATIISAAGGMQYAQECGDLKNGVFTYSIIEAFNNNSSLKVSELKKIVGLRVIQLTNGLQKPTSRNETTNYDWIIW